jgi:putative lipoic acid-binding regulatory protein
LFSENSLTIERQVQVMMKIRKQKLRLEYPCLWLYKVIGTDRDEIQSAVHSIIRDRSCKISVSRQSETAKYISLNVEVTVESDSHRTSLYEELRAHRAVKLVL